MENENKKRLISEANSESHRLYNIAAHLEFLHGPLHPATKQAYALSNDAWRKWNALAHPEWVNN